MKRIIVLSLFAAYILGACKKESSATPDPTPTPPVVSEADKVKDTALEIARDIYLWYDQIPSTFNPRTFADPDKVMQGIRPYSIETGFTKAVDRWSFGIKQAEWDNASSGISGDLGIGIFFLSANDLRVSYVEKESAAGLAGVQRSWRITKINGSTAINTSSSSIDFIVNAIYGGSQANITFQKPDGSSVDLALTPSTYNEQPLILDTVYTSGGKNVGYFILNSFLGDTTEIKNGFSNIFAKFAAKNVTDIIVDLRYNGGGYVLLQEELANYLAPNGENGKMMYSQSFNDKYSQYNRIENFVKKGSVNPAKIVFIISQNTASASEALVNIMTPHVEVKTVGPSASHGKPVGFFNIPVGDWYVFPVSLRIVNSLNEGNYFDGFTPDNQVMDGLDKPWGDVSEDCLASALKYLTTGSFKAETRDNIRTDLDMIRSYNTIRSNKYKFMVESRKNIPGLR
ncbi:S41 family peptidase [Flavihumibacter fluvii]|uniref:S41 family peptidase n=1 Tax=Flavihumibacter fluvii TaxID=2838157 RepID=UPI001BDEC34F|nr:S41 family peptidase [Flavihumibacter fluvii]ULQ53874.1 S41 family peptidase [Flavihumibacter fluvii]